MPRLRGLQVEAPERGPKAKGGKLGQGVNRSRDQRPRARCDHVLPDANVLPKSDRETRTGLTGVASLLNLKKSVQAESAGRPVH